MIYNQPVMPRPPSPRKRVLPFTKLVRDLIRSVPPGKVASYGQIAALAGDARQARQVSWILHSSSEVERLPWHRIIASSGRISLPMNGEGRLQARLLRAEGVAVGPDGRVEMAVFGWIPRRRRRTALDALDLDALD